MSTIFITGTDTEIGKTHVATHLLQALAARGLRCAGFKPVAAGAAETPDGLRNGDALALQAAGNVDLPYETLNPYCLAPPIAPHLAAAEAGIRIEKSRILRALAKIEAQAECVLVEGAGGWRVPLNDEMDFADLAIEAGWPVLLVVGMRLGCINHALLSAESIARHGCLLGWVANCLPPAQNRLEDNIKALESAIPAPLLGVFGPDGKGPEILHLEPFLKAP